MSRKKLIEQPLSIFKKINIENLTKITSLSLKEKYNDFKEKMKQKEKNKIELFKKEKIKELKKEKLEQEKQKIEETRLIKQNELNAINEEKQRLDKQEKLKIKITKQEQQIERKKIKLEAQRIKAEEQKLRDEDEEKARQDDLKLKEEKLRLEFLEKQRVRQEQQRAKTERDKSIVLEKNPSWGGLLDNFSIDGFRFDKFIHLSFAKDEYVNEIFYKTPFLKHKPLSSNYYKGFWLKHPAQNNLYPLSNKEKQKILNDFKKRENLQINNYEDWLRVQYGDYFTDNFPIVYTEKYWTVKAKDLETKWVGNRMYKPSIEEVENGCKTDLTPNTYYTKEMRYPKKGGYKSFLNPLVKYLDIRTNSNVKEICLNKKKVTLFNGDEFEYDNLINSIPKNCTLLIKEHPNWKNKYSK